MRTPRPKLKVNGGPFARPAKPGRFFFGSASNPALRIKSFAEMNLAVLGVLRIRLDFGFGTRLAGVGTSLR